jgi:hypothetical protein
MRGFNLNVIADQYLNLTFTAPYAGKKNSFGS